jgi:D-serine dehydratase
MTMQLGDIEALRLAPGTKGIPLDGSIRTVGDLAGRGLNPLHGHLPMPVALLKRAALDNNLSVMQAYVDRVGARLAPHAKTTMCPQLFARQLDAGAWGLTVATMTQLKLCHDLGAPRIILANQLVGRAEIESLARLTASAPDRPCYVLIDSAEGARAISEGFGQTPGAPAARLLIEVGMAGGRCGVRTLQEGLALAKLVRSLPHLELHGIEGYEGLIFSDRAAQDAIEVDTYLGSVLQLHDLLRAESLFADPDQVILTAGGSAYYDLVAHTLAGHAPGAIPVLRSGCYVTHDSGFYRELLTRMDDRSVAGPPPRLLPALEVWTRVISRPQADQAIVMMGKRDVSHDIHLPMARRWLRQGLHVAPQPVEGLVVEKLSDQHGFLFVPPGTDLAVGDLLGFEISHPCTTFDKWSLLLEVDDDYTVVGGLKTFF